MRSIGTIKSCQKKGDLTGRQCGCENGKHSLFSFEASKRNSVQDHLSMCWSSDKTWKLWCVIG